ncbi:type IVB secretion system apparatus protein IcmL/DotI [Candidatus Synchoanobacter obligatus]|uniref:Type IVB secretion system apparatus protein IcmL/DotI n=1 Tax=Candidatus Synchoanobacter obligatus TaxID=2919597 RepID=A0ABT1L5B6_9GAMM|nr:type IVB secretion system apparatus protein IcmL/DotI [Candidatus Synchoanobacter obligatus]MCP8352372.1 type IVB secretion system apparatus protein IcmL/DotI [Candidatus Synchoanobacter obligatus]
MSDALETIALRNDFYRDGYRKSLVIILTLIVTNLIAFMSVLKLYDKTEPVAFFATSPDGRIIPVLPLSEPGMKDAELVEWAKNSAIRAYTYDFVNYKTSLQDASKFFTDVGWTKFQQALQKAKTLKTVVDQRLVMTARATEAPQIISQRVLNGRYTWKVVMPLILKLKGPKNVDLPVRLTMMVQRVSLVNNPEGVGIVNFVVSEG